MQSDNETLKSLELRTRKRAAAPACGIDTGWAWLVFAGWMFLAPIFVSAADAPADFPSPISAEESLKHFRLDDGLGIQIVAAEPEVIDPIAIAFGEDGALWVVEMRDYPKGPKPGEKPFSKIKRLYDKDGDGRYETATIFVEELLFPTGLLPWKDGAIVTLAGEIAFFADRDGDGKAEFKETWFTGFAEENSQLRHNHPTLGLDGYIYVANGLRGGTVVPQKPEWKGKSEPVKLTGFDFRFDPHTGACEAIAGHGQFGLTFDDWGNRFVCSNRNPCQHVVLENWHLKLNPNVAVPSVMHDVAAAGENSRIYPISKFWTTSQLHGGQFTAACGVMIYRGDGLGELYYGNAFTCDPTGSLVHREVLTPSGATFTGKSPYDEREFLATPDTWCRPVNLSHGPDGALYVVDMYRAVIEHPDWVPVELKNRPDERYGENMGRIYRIVRKEPRAQQAVRLDQATTSDLAALLSHANAWQRDTAFRLLSQKMSDFALRVLKDALLGSATPQGKVAAIELCRHPSQAFDDSWWPVVVKDPSPRVREALWRTSIPGDKPSIDSDPRTRFQQALMFAVIPDGDPAAKVRDGDRDPYDAALSKMIQLGVEDVWIRTAILLNVSDNGPKLLNDTVVIASQKTPISGIVDFLEELSTVIAVRDQSSELQAIFNSVFTDLFTTKPSRDSLWAIIRGLAIGQQRRGKSWTDLVRAQSDEIKVKLSEAAKEASTLAANHEVPAPERLSALRLLKFHVDGTVAISLLELATSDSESTIQLAALDCLAGYASDEIGPTLLETFPAETPAVRRAILDVLLANDDRAELLLNSLEDQSISATEIDAPRAARLTSHRNADIKTRSAKLFAAAAADRAAVLEKYKTAARMDADVKSGRQVFEKNCATCHRVSDVGVNVGPDVGDNYARTPEALLLSILDPNRAVDNNYFAYTVVTVDGRVLTGIITAETASSITLKQPEGKIEVILRNDIDELKGSGISLMPVGVEKNINVAEMADLITFLKNWRYVDGNVPAGTK
jgi:putative membrane-bound dehydrogenase-like protein